MKGKAAIILCTELRGCAIEGITVDIAQNVYYTNGVYGQVKILPYQTKEPKELITLENSDLRGVVWHPQNILYFCDWKLSRILSFEIGTTQLKVILLPTTIREPWGIALDQYNDIYFTDKHCVRKLSLPEMFLQNIAGCGSSESDCGYKDGRAKSAKFAVPSGLVVSEDDTIYVCDYSNHCIRQIRYDTVSTISGSPMRYGLKDGSMGTHKLPYGLALDSDGNLLVCEINNAVRIIDLKSNTVSSGYFEGIANFYCICKGRGSSFFMGCGTKVVKVDRIWDAWERYLWIGHLKEEPQYCLLAALPKDIIKDIACRLWSEDKITSK